MMLKKTGRFFRKQEATVYAYVFAMLLPNLILACTEPYSWSTILASLMLPAAFYMAVSVARPRPGIVMLCTLPLMVLNAFQIVILYLFGGSIIAVDMFTNLFTTNVSEAGELLSNLWPAIVFVCIIYLPILALSIRSSLIKDRLSSMFRRKMIYGALCALVVGGVATVISAVVRPDFGIRQQIFPVNVIYNIRLSLDRWKQSEAYPETSKNFTFNAVRTARAEGREIYVMVIGEASRATSWSLFGYERETTPRLSQRVGSGLVPFDDVLTQSNATHKSVPVLLSPVSALNFDEIYGEKSIITAFKEAGFRTLFISNQVPNRSLIDYFSAEADRRIDISPREGQLYTDNRPDGEMLPYLRDAILSTEENLFIVLHTYGSHFDYTKRYPHDFAKFTPDHLMSVSKENREMLRNSYDNSVYYTDYVLDQIIQLLDSTKACTALYYCADHGEDLMDDRRERFLHASPTPTYYQLHVAALAWFSEQYRSQFPDKYEAVLGNCSRPATTACMFHSVADMASIESPYVDSTRSFSCPGFQQSLRRMYLTDHNTPVEFYNSGLQPEDFEALDRYHIEYDKNHVHDIRY
ncbi:MAG TPA: lipid A phosphoethanolamine transferase [Candidatus Alistipes merdigallinarum]|nr:lipid A phosphoethanolamine transferase [Candidatus Alistipes merdigallinarum]